MTGYLNIKGMQELRHQVKGSPTIKVAIIDMAIDMTHSCFKGAKLTNPKSYWIPQQELSPKEDKKSKLHGTFVTSMVVGQEDSEVVGIAPGCTGEFISFGLDTVSTPDLDLVRAINVARENGANIIHISVATPTVTSVVNPLLEKTIKECIEENILIVAPGGNDDAECLCIPAVAPGVLVVGALNEEGIPFRFSNFGGIYQKQGVTVNGAKITAAKAGGGTMTEKGTSCAAPIVTGVAALLMSLQQKLGQKVDAKKVRNIILNSATRISPTEVSSPEERQRYLVGKLNITKAMEAIMGKTVNAQSLSQPTQTKVLSNSQPITIQKPETVIKPSSIKPQSIVSSNNHNLVFALGTLGYDFGNEARKDAFAQMMQPYKLGGTVQPVNPYDPMQMVKHFEDNLSETKSVIWTLNLELTPIYALEADGAFAVDVYKVLLGMLSDQLKPDSDASYVDKVSIPGRLTGKHVKLLSGQEVPVIKLGNNRGIYGWKINSLISEAVKNVSGSQAQKASVEAGLQSFLEKIYYNLQNLGITAQDRALNYAATNAFQATDIFADSMVKGMELNSINVQKSTFGRIDSDCWDVLISFFNPKNNQEAKRIYRFTIDVSDLIPVSIGKVRSWSES